MSDKFDYETAREEMRDAGLDPDDLPEKNPEKRDAYLRKVKMDPERYKPSRRCHPGDGSYDTSGSGPSGGSGTTGCFLTTACVRSKNLSDNCDELTTLRAFRDFYMGSSAQGKEEINYYYEIAPKIVAAIDQRPDANLIWDQIFVDIITPAVSLIKRTEFSSAYRLYKKCVLELEQAFLTLP